MLNVKKQKTAAKVSSNKCLQESRLAKIHRLILSPQTKLYCFFLKYSNKIFDEINLLLQRGEPCVHIILRQLNAVLKNILISFLKPSVVADSRDLKQIEYMTKTLQKSDSELMIGKEARDYIKVRQGDADLCSLTDQDLKQFYTSVRSYYQAATQYILKTWPLSSKLFEHAEVVDITLRSTVTFASVQYFVDRFPCILDTSSAPDSDDKLELEFANYQIETFSAIPDLFEASRIDRQWDTISHLKDTNGAVKYPLLSKVMKAILVIPHSNAHCERVFSIVRKNKTDFRGSMSRKTLQALLIEKIANAGIKCHQREYSPKILQQAKKATYIVPVTAATS